MSRCGLGSAATQLSLLRPSSMHGGQRHRAALSAPSHFLFASEHHTPSVVDVDVEPLNINEPLVVTIHPTLSPSTGDAIATREHGITAFLPAQAHLRRQPSSTLHGRILGHHSAGTDTSSSSSQSIILAHLLLLPSTTWDH